MPRFVSIETVYRSLTARIRSWHSLCDWICIIDCCAFGSLLFVVWFWWVTEAPYAWVILPAALGNLSLWGILVIFSDKTHKPCKFFNIQHISRSFQSIIAIIAHSWNTMYRTSAYWLFSFGPNGLIQFSQYD